VKRRIPFRKVGTHRRILLEELITLPDPDDPRVFAAAIRAGDNVMVTINLSDFPAEILAPRGVEAQHPTSSSRACSIWLPTWLSP
jgi:hypothetical protein